MPKYDSRLILLLLSLAPFWIGCEDEAGTITFTDIDPPLYTIFIDTVTISSGTVLLDSIPTSGASNILVGSWEDEKLGKIYAKGFFQPGLPAAFIIDEDDAVFDSITVMLPLQYAYYDTLRSVSLSVHRVTEEMDIHDNGLLYNTSAPKYEPDPLGTVTFTPYPNKNDSVEVKLKDEIGLEILSFAESGDSETASNDLFTAYLKGLALISDVQGNSPIIGFGLGAKLKLYYHINIEEGEEEFIESFPIIDGNINFNQVVSDKSETKLSTLADQKSVLPAPNSDGETYIQSGIGLMTRLDIPDLKFLYEFAGPNIAILKATLEIAPTQNSELGNSPLPDSIVLYQTNGINEINEGLETISQLNIDDEFDKDTRYEIDITNYISSLLASEGFGTGELLAALPNSSYLSNLDRLYLKESGIKLKIYLSVINN